jgi:hypothetical protein
MNFDQMPKVELHLYLDCCLIFKAIHIFDPTVTLDLSKRVYSACQTEGRRVDFSAMESGCW